MKKVIVIGAGILGASTAYQLSKLGADVLIVDRKDTGQATDAAAGIICPWLSQRRNKAWYRLAKAGAGFYPSLIHELTEAGEANTGYEKVGALCLHHDLDKLEKMRARAEQRIVDAPEIGELTMLSDVEAREKFPLISEGYHALHVSGAARVNGRELRDALLRASINQGARRINASAEILHNNNNVSGAIINGLMYEADEVIVCAGAWSNELLHPLGVMIDVRYQRAQIMHFNVKPNVNTEKWPVVMPPTTQYLLAFDDQRVVLGATHENDVVGYDSAVTVKGMYELLESGIETASGLMDCTLNEIRVGFRPSTSEFLPVFGRVRNWNGLIVANGLGSSGLTVGPYLGLQIAKLALEKKLDIPQEDYALEKAMV